VPDSVLVILDEETHAKYRRPVQHAYSLTSLKGYEPYVDDIIRTLVDVIETHVESGEAVNISSWLYFCE
jgi:cytochrome P450